MSIYSEKTVPCPESRGDLISLFTNSLKKLNYKSNNTFSKLQKLEVQLGHLGMHKKLNYKSNFTLFKSFLKSTLDILGMHNRH